MAEPRPGQLTPKLSEMLISEIKRQEVTGKSSRQIARDFGVHYQTVANYRRKLERAGVISRLPAGKTKLKLDNPAAGVQDAQAPAGTLAIADLWQAMPDLEILTPEQILKRLSFLSMSPQVPPSIHTQASKVLYELIEAENSKRNLEATAPKTVEELVDRLRVLRSCVGPEAWRNADTEVTQEEESWKRKEVPLDSVPDVEPVSIVAEEVGAPSPP